MTKKFKPYFFETSERSAFQFAFSTGRRTPGAFPCPTLQQPLTESKTKHNAAKRNAKAHGCRDPETSARPDSPNGRRLARQALAAFAEPAQTGRRTNFFDAERGLSAVVVASSGRDRISASKAAACIPNTHVSKEITGPAVAARKGYFSAQLHALA